MHKARAAFAVVVALFAASVPVHARAEIASLAMTNGTSNCVRFQFVQTGPNGGVTSAGGAVVAAHGTHRETFDQPLQNVTLVAALQQPDCKHDAAAEPISLDKKDASPDPFAYAATFGPKHVWTVRRTPAGARQ